MRGIFELLKISLKREKLSEVKKESLYDRILAKIELQELSHSEQLFLNLGEGEIPVQREKPIWSWSIQMFGSLLAIMVVMAGMSLGGNLLPNGSFEQGKLTPQGWHLKGGEGAWENFGKEGARSVSLKGDGRNTSFGICDDFKPEGGKAYLIRYWVRIPPESRGGMPIAGISTLCRSEDIPRDGSWHLRGFIGRTPLNRPDARTRLGQKGVEGVIGYDDIEILLVISVHRGVGRTVLGENECIEGGTYRFETDLGGFTSNDSRTLYSHTAAFDTDHWLLTGREEEWIIYRHRVGYPILSAEMKLVLGYELPFIVALCVPIIQSGGSIKLGELLKNININPSSEK